MIAVTHAATLAAMCRLKTRTKVGYGIGELGVSMMFTMIGTFLLTYLTTVVGITTAVAGIVLGVGRIWDVLMDPMVGHLSDQTRSRWGRRRPWLFGGSWLAFGAIVLMFSPPPIGLLEALGMSTIAWVVVTTCLLNSGFSAVVIPYGALTPELTDDFEERTSVNGWRMSFSIVGTLVGAGAVVQLVGWFGGGASGWQRMAIAAGAIAAATALTAFASVRERPASVSHTRTGAFRSYAHALNLRPFLLVLIPWTLHVTGISIIQANLLFAFTAIYGRPHAFSFGFLVLLAGAIVATPVWVRLAGRVGKREGYNIGMVLLAITMLLFFLFGPGESVFAMYITMFAAGFGVAANDVLPASMLPDVVEYDFAESGVRREGVFYSLWSLAAKLGQGVGLTISGLMLGWFGFVEGADGILPAQPARALFGIRLLLGPIAALFFVAGAVVLRHYPITRDAYAAIQHRVRAKRSTAASGGGTAGGFQPSRGDNV